MPLYEFECIKCGEVFEKVVYDGKKKVECPSCGSDKVKRLIGKIVEFKGILCQ